LKVKIFTFNAKLKLSLLKLKRFLPFELSANDLLFLIIHKMLSITWLEDEWKYCWWALLSFWDTCIVVTAVCILIRTTHSGFTCSGATSPVIGANVYTSWANYITFSKMHKQRNNNYQI